MNNSDPLAAAATPTFYGETTPPSTEIPITSGFGAVMEQEENIRASIEGYLNGDLRGEAAGLQQLLRHQQSQLGANISRLEERYEMLPHAARFQTWRDMTRPPVAARRRAATTSPESLGELLAQHRRVLAAIAGLIIQCADGAHGEAILVEVAQSHEQMLASLAGLLGERQPVADHFAIPVIATEPVTKAAARWENEGGGAEGPVA
jgi:hypothetical protein